MLLTLAPLVIFCTGAVLSDVRTHRVPNFYNASFLVSGVCFWCARNGVDGAIHSITAACFATLLLMAPFLLRMLGGGDLKFFAAAGAIAGRSLVLPGLLLGVAAGGVFAVAMLWKHSSSEGVLRALVLIENGQWRLPVDRRSGSTVYLPYTIPLSVGLLGAATFQLFILKV
jgi:prepilin peptidase CpaA